MEKTNIKSWQVIFSILVVLVLLFFFAQNYIAQFVWKNFRGYDVSLRLLRSDAKVAFDIAEYYFNGEVYDLDRAEVAYKKTLQIDPKYRLANYQLARVLFVKGQSEPALDAINRELEYYPENRRSYYVRGLIYGFSDKLSEAEADFKIFTEWAPMEWAGWNDLAWILAKQGKYEEGLEILLLAFKKVPEADENIWLQNSLGVAYLNLNNYEKAEETFLKVKEISKTMPIEIWLSAYPGNSRNKAEKGFESFKAAIEANISKTRYLDN